MAISKASELLSAWERGLVQRPIERALTLLATVHRGTAPDQLARFSVGQRDAGLLELREQAFGPELTCLTNCANCDERLELGLNVADLRVGFDGDAPAVISLSVADYEVVFRLPDSFDLMAITNTKEVMTARALLLERCLLGVTQGEEKKAVVDLPESVIAAVVDQMAKADPRADLHLTVCCPLCRHEWQQAFDIASFVWLEINWWANRTLHDVHSLASAYGWGEAEILRLSPARRQVYLEMINQ